MKPVLAWVKSNLVIVILTVVILILLPTAWFLSNMWDTKIRTAQEKQAKDQYQKLAALKVNYTLPQLDPKAQPVSHNEVPNLALINWFKEQRDVLTTQANAVVKKAEDFNKGVGPDAASVGRTEHKPLVEGVFPAGEQAKIDEMEDALLGNRGRPNPYREMLKEVRAGDPADPVALAESLTEYRTREIDKITAGKRDLTPEEQTTLAKQMTDRRVGEYQARAAAVSFYASMNVLPKNRQAAFVPTGAHLDQNNLNLADMFLFQWDYWIMKDIFAAIKLANTTGNTIANVDRAVVKRIEKLEITLPVARTGGSSGGSGSGGFDPRMPDPYANQNQYQDPATMGAAPVATTPGMAPLDYTRSITGRLATNNVYDTRVVTLTAVVSSARLPDFVSAIERTNFMTVTDMDLSEVKVWEDLAQGFYYGPEHVVRVNMTIETVWLRSWMTKYMPATLKTNLKIEAPPVDPNAPAAPVPGAG